MILVLPALNLVFRPLNTLSALRGRDEYVSHSLCEAYPALRD